MEWETMREAEEVRAEALVSCPEDIASPSMNTGRAAGLCLAKSLPCAKAYAKQPTSLPKACEEGDSVLGFCPSTTCPSFRPHSTCPLLSASGSHWVSPAQVMPLGIPAIPLTMAAGSEVGMGTH